MRACALALVWMTLAAGVAGAGMQTVPAAGAAAASEKPVQGLAVREGTAPLSEKQKALLADTEKLVKMAAELKVSVDKSNKNELSLEVVRQAEAIEKLAKSVKERIREAR